MNPLTNAANLNKMNERELELGLTGTKNSWHNIYKDSAWIFVGGLSYDLTEGDVICVFSQYGEIVNINMVRDKKTGKTKGFAFICYEDQRSTILAVDNFNGTKLLSRTIRVDHVNDYRPPNEDDENIDDVTRKVRAEGVAPQALPPSDSSDDDYLLPPDTDGKKKKKKDKKKAKKLKKEKHNKSEDRHREKESRSLAEDDNKKHSSMRSDHDNEGPKVRTETDDSRHLKSYDRFRGEERPERDRRYRDRLEEGSKRRRALPDSPSVTSRSKSDHLGSPSRYRRQEENSNSRNRGRSRTPDRHRRYKGRSTSRERPRNRSSSRDGRRSRSNSRERPRNRSSSRDRRKNRSTSRERRRR